jgi:Concanavalin A-like lectin/glucanases superfamily/Domain of unknown function (DUF2341)
MNIIKNKKIDYRYYIGIAVIGLVIVFGTLYLIRTPKIAEAEWFNDGWYYRQQFDIYNNEATALTDFQVAISTSTLQLASLNTAGKTNADFSDLRFTDINGNLLDYWFGDDTDTMYSVYIKFSNLPASATSTLFMYYGNQSASDERDGSAVFEFFDDFSNINSSFYDTGSGVSINENELRIIGPDPRSWGNHYYISNDEYSRNFIVESDIRGESKGDYMFGVFDSDIGTSYTDMVYAFFSYTGYTQFRIYEDSNNRDFHGPTLNTDQTYKAKIEVLSTGAKYYIDDVLIYDSSYSSEDNLRIGYTVAAQTQDFDSLRVRQYTTTEPTITLTSGASEEQGPGSVAYWSFDEGYGSTAYDKTTNSNDGTITGATWQTEDQCIAGKCLYFDGDGDYVTLDLFTVEKTGGSVCFWYKSLGDYTANYGDRGTIMSNKLSYLSLIYLRDNGSSYSWNAESDTNEDYIIYTSFLYEKNKWQQLCMVMDSDIVYSYLDGQLIDTEDADDDVSFSMIGAGDYDHTDPIYNQFFHGYLDEVKIYPYARTEAQIFTDYNAGLAGVGSSQGISVTMGGESNKFLSDGLIGYWKMDESSWSGVADEVIDASGNGNHGVRNGDATTTSTAKYAMAGEFAGIGNNVNCGDVSTADWENLTVSTWIYWDGNTVNGYGVFLYKGAVTGVGSHALKSNGYLLVQNGNGNFFSDNLGDISSDEWVLYTYVYNQSEGKEYIYINGVQKGEQSRTGNITQNSNDLEIVRDDNFTYSGQLDEVRIYNKALSSREIKQLYEYAPGPIAYYDFEENTGTTLYDKSGNENNGTLTNMDDNDWVLGKYGSALDFDGDDDYTIISDDDTLDLTGVGSWGAWIKVDSTAANSRYIIMSKGYSYTGSANWPNSSYSIEVNNGTFWPHIYTTDGLGTYAYNGLSVGIPDYDNWHYVLVTFDRGTAKMYLNGVLVDTETTTYDQINSTSQDLYIGRHTGTYYCNGQIDEVKIYNYARSQKQILEDMNAGRPASKSPIGYWKFDEGYGTNVNDFGLGDNDGTITGADWTNNGKINKALDFNGTSGYVDLGSEKPSDLTGDITISAWVNPTSWGENSRGRILSNDQFWLETYGISNPRLLFTSNASASPTSANDSISLDTWQHVLITRPSAGTDTNFYINGELSGTANQDSGTPVAGTANTFIGNSSVGNRTFDGLIDEVKIFNYLLTTDEIRKEYNQGQAVVMGSERNTSSTWDDGGFGGDAPIAYWNFEEGSGTTLNDISANDNTGTLTSMDENTDWVLGKPGWALEFDGVDDYVRASAEVTDFNFGTADFSASFWTKYTDAKAYGSFIGQGYLGGEIGWGFYYDATGKVSFQIRDSGLSYIYSDSVLNDGNWHYITGKRESGTITMYVDGVLQSDTDSTVRDLSGSGEIFAIGARSNNNGVGWDFEAEATIDEVKIYDYARTPAQIAWDYNGGKSIGHWPLDDGEGITANDISGNDNDSTLTTMDPVTDWLDGSNCKFEGCLDFDGEDDYVGIDDTIVLADDTEWNISFWANFDDVTKGAQGLIGNLNTASNYELISYYGENDIVWYNEGGYVTVRWRNNYSLSNDTWYHFNFVCDGTGITFYLNGNALERDIPTDGDTGMKVKNMAQYGNNLYYFDGSMDDVRIYNYDLSDDQIKNVYNNGLIRFE